MYAAAGIFSSNKGSWPFQITVAQAEKRTQLSAFSRVLKHNVGLRRPKRSV